MTSIFRSRNPDVETLFRDAGQPEKVMCVALDYAKQEHTAMICDGSGRRLRGRLDVHNTAAGLRYLLDILAKLWRKHHIRSEHTFFGGEDCGPYAFNFVHALASRGFLVVGMNCKQAKDERETTKASTDLIDTIGVAGMMLKMRGRTIDQPTEQLHVIKKLRRERQGLLKAHAAAAHRMYGLVDQLFPGFLDEKRSGITPFGRACLWLMEKRFSAAEIHARKRPALAKRLREFGIQDPEGAVTKLKETAELALPPPPTMVPSLQRCLSEELAMYRTLGSALHGLDTDIAKYLAATPGAMLTTIPGISLRRAPGLYCELADPARRRGVKRLCALAGIVPYVKQTGGRDKPAVAKHRSHQCNHYLKDIVVGAAVSLSEYGDPEMRSVYQADKAMGRDARMRMARRVIRISLSVVDRQVFYLPPSLHQHGTHEQLRAYYRRMWPKVLVKWRDAGAIKQATAEGAPLRQWRDMAQSLYDLELDLRSPQTGRK
jgi:transposase